MCTALNERSLLTGLIVIKCLHVTVDWCFCKPWDMQLTRALSWDTLHLLMIVVMTSLYACILTSVWERNNSFLAFSYICNVSFCGIYGECEGRVQLSRYRYSLRPGRSGYRSLLGRDFSHPSLPALGPLRLMYKDIGSLSGGGKATGAWRWPSTGIQRRD